MSGLTTKFGLAITALGAVVLVCAQLADLPVLVPIAKLSASTGFIATAISVGCTRSVYGRVILAGLAFSWAGDAFLLGSSDTVFLMGLISFLLAHLLYSAGFLVHGIRMRWALAAAPMVALVSLGAMVWLTPYIGADMRIPVRVYTVVISLMVALAIGARGAGATWRIPVGAALFYFSDLSVAAGQFAQPDFPNYVWGLPFYFAGQALLALSTRVAPSSP